MSTNPAPFRIIVCAAVVIAGARAGDARGLPEKQPAPARPANALKVLKIKKTAAPAAQAKSARLAARGKTSVDAKHSRTATAAPRIRSSRSGVRDARTRIRVKDALARLPRGERRALIALAASPRVQGSLPVRRAVAAFLVLRALKGGAALPISAADMTQMTGSKRWTARRMANLALVLRAAVGIAQAEGLSANAAFAKALKQYGIHKKFNRGVCGA
jgi:hypothetical protein